MNEHKFAEAVRKSCLKILQRSYEEAGISGLCHEGRWEYAIDVLQNMAIEELLKKIAGAASSDSILR
ncbi:MAG: hypothetical protein WAL90_08180 [Desulfobacterales bacterium]